MPIRTTNIVDVTIKNSDSNEYYHTNSSSILNKDLQAAHKNRTIVKKMMKIVRDFC